MRKGTAMKKKETSPEIEKIYDRYEAEYSREVQEMLVLTGEAVGGAIRFGRDVWEHSAGFLASVDLGTGTLGREKGFLKWLGERGQEKFSGKKIRPRKIYHVRCRKKMEDEGSQDSGKAVGNTWMLVEIVGKVRRHPQLKQIMKQTREEHQQGTVFLETFCGQFELERKFNCFNGEVDWLGEKCSVSLDCDAEGAESMDRALAFFRRLYDDPRKWDEAFRAYAAKELFLSANDWQEDSGEGTEPITEESFAKRIRIVDISMGADGEYSVYYDDDGMFYEHAVVIRGNVDNGMDRADIEG